MKTKIDALAGRKPLFAFDLDSTVTRCELLPLLAREVGLENEMAALTEACMQSGAVFGAASMLDGMIDRIEEELGRPASIIATGGLSGSVVPYCRHEIKLDDTLLLRGLGKIYEKNRRDAAHRRSR